MPEQARLPTNPAGYVGFLDLLDWVILFVRPGHIPLVGFYLKGSAPIAAQASPLTSSLGASRAKALEINISAARAECAHNNFRR
jgi:hypothetical protein